MFVNSKSRNSKPVNIFLKIQFINPTKHLHIYFNVSGDKHVYN